MRTDRFSEAIAGLDAANSEDPNRETFEGVDHPKELLYARRMTAWLERLAPDAPQTVRLAVRAQHIRRWSIPRSDYSMDRRGYRLWRTTLARFHADTAGAILTQVGYDGETISRVQALLRKERLKTDPEAQLLEDVACLVFLDCYFEPFSEKHDNAKLVEIVRKTWRKMSPRGREAATELNLPPRLRVIVGEAIAK